MTSLLDVNTDCLNEILDYINIIDLVKFKCVSKYIHILINNYIKNNKNKCDMEAYCCDYLLTPEYLIIKEDENTSCYGKVIRHLYKFSSTLRLFLYDENYYPYKLNIISKNTRLEQDIINIYMPKLRYIFSDSININLVYIPKLKYNVNLVNNKNIYYLGCSINKVYNHVENVIFNASIPMIENIKYFPNCKKLYIYSNIIEPNNITESNIIEPNNIKEIYTNEGMSGEIYTKIFPSLIVLYINLTISYNVNNICLRRTNKKSGEMNDKNAVKIHKYLLDSEKIIMLDTKKIIIMEYMVLPDLLQLFPNLEKIYICQDNFNFKLGNIQMVGINFKNEVKKLIFS